MRVAILGGTRFIGRRVADMLVKAGADVTLFHRGTTGSGVPGTQSVHGDRASEEDLARLAETRPDAVLDLSSYGSEWTRIAVEAFAGRIGQFVYVSSGAVYEPSAELPWPESTPVGPDAFWGTYAIEKLKSERILWAAHEAGRLPVTIFRFPFVLGPGNYADREAFVISRIESGRPILLPGGGKAVNQHVYVDDAAGAMVAALFAPDSAAGHAYNCAFPRGITNLGFVRLCEGVIGREAHIVAIDEEALGLSTDAIDLTNLVFPFPSRHYMLQVDRLKTDLGFESRLNTRRMIEEFAAWWPSVEDRRPKAYARETAALEALGLAATA
jgi:nucleoside-diphosphate-sugar epimerase